jgi:hypothetical protein
VLAALARGWDSELVERDKRRRVLVRDKRLQVLVRVVQDRVSDKAEVGLELVARRAGRLVAGRYGAAVAA